MRPSCARSTTTPMRASSFAIVATSMRRGTPRSESGLAVRSAAHMIGSAAFLAPEMRTSPSSGRPPLMRSLSKRFPLRRCERTHGKRMDLFAHALTERGVHELMALHAVSALELARYDERLEMLAVARDLDMLAGESRFDAVLYAFGCHHRSL